MFAMSMREALSNLRLAKLRSFLAILGVLVGTASVVAMVSCGKLVTHEALKQFQKLGTDLMAVSLNPKNETTRAYLKLFSVQDARDLVQKVKGVNLAAPYTTSYLQINYAGEMLNATIIGSTEDLQKAIKITLQEGRFVSDLDRYNYYCVLGYNLNKKMQQLQKQDLLGRQIQIGQNIFTVIGIAEKWPENGFFYQDVNFAVLIPIDTARSLSNFNNINNIVFSLEKDSDIDRIQVELSQNLNAKLPDIEHSFHSAKEIVESMKSQANMFTIFLGLIGSISLLVGGIGVMNVMLASVIERKREIGIRKAVGARRSDIALLFLIESVTLSLFGGVLGVIIGVLISYIIASLQHWEFSLFFLPISIGFVVSVIVGIFFGFYPALSAAKLDPIATLRTE